MASRTEHRTKLEMLLTCVNLIIIEKPILGFKSLINISKLFYFTFFGTNYNLSN